ncbi:MAG: hypothetical protein CL778_02895 [Chloroflexi bacterium]|nr:hypothetical protein [Chloroflexota bacterium]|tara:strand:- start:39024 stop:40199 length:1176 start_codon:yes stop_codon:yes gene_type:complete
MKLAVISVHGCPVRQIGLGSAGGMNVFLLESSKIISDLDVNVDIYTRHHDIKDPEIIQLTPNVRVIHIKAGGFDIDKESIYPLLPNFAEKINLYSNENHLKYDLISSHYWLSGLVGNILSKSWKLNHVIMFHTLSLIKEDYIKSKTSILDRKNGELQAIENSDGILVWSENEKQSIIDKYSAKSSKIKIIRPGVYSELFNRNFIKKNHDSNNISILFVGRLEPLKGIETVIKAIAELNDIDIKLNIAGGDAEEGETLRLKNIALKYNIMDRIKFLGVINRKLLPKLYKEHDILIMPSYYESLGLSALEAQSSGLPVIASDVGGISEVVINNETGFLVYPADNFAKYAEKIRILSKDHNLRKSFGNNARRHAKTFDWKIVGPRLVDVYNSFI